MPEQTIAIGLGNTTRETYRLFVNDERTVFVRVWDSGTVEVAQRSHPSHTWGPPTYLTEEKV